MSCLDMNILRLCCKSSTLSLLLACLKPVIVTAMLLHCKDGFDGFDLEIEIFSKYWCLERHLL